MTTRKASSLSFHLFFASWMALTAGLSLGAVACGSDSGEDTGAAGAGSESGEGGSSNNNGGSNNNNNGGSSSNNGGSSNNNGGNGGSNSCVSCSDGCPNIVCACKDGEIINTTSCNNGCCEPKEAACPDSCSEHGGWSGSSGGGGNGGSSNGNGGSSGGGNTGNDIGGECQSDGDCISKICIFNGGAAFGYCSKMCESFADCPSFWDCEPVGNASGNYCVQSD